MEPVSRASAPSAMGLEAELQEQLIRSEQEKRELQDYAERVTRELRRYQQARPTPPPSGLAEEHGPLPPWATNMQMMSPLLFAYEERISELEMVIERSVGLAEQAQVLTKENDALRVELQERTEQLRNAQVIAPFRDLDKDNEQPEELQELYRISVEQNEALAQQNQLLKLHLERMQQSMLTMKQQSSEVQARAVEEARAVQTRAVEEAKAIQDHVVEEARVLSEEQEHATMKLKTETERVVTTLRAEKEKEANTWKAHHERLTHEWHAERERLTSELLAEREDATRAYNKERDRADTYARQRSAAEGRLDELTGELVEEVRARESLEAQVEGLQQENQLHLQSLDFYKKSYDDRCAMAGDEEERIQSDLARVSQSERDLRHRCARLERELSDVTDQLYVTRREGEAMKQEAEQMLPLMESMDSRLRDVSERYKRVQQELGEKESQLGDLLVAREAWSSAEHALKRQADRQESRLAAELEALRSQRDHEVTSLSASSKRAVADLEERLRKTEQAAAELTAQNELIEKQRVWEAAALERQNTLHAVERDRLQGDLEEMQQVRLRVERQADASKQDVNRLKSELSSMSAEVRESAARASTESATSRMKLQSVERSLGQAQDEVQTCEARLAAAGAEQKRIQTELQEEQRKLVDSVEQERQRALGEQRSFERQLRAVQARSRQDEQRAVELLQAQESLRQRWQAEAGHEKETLEAEVERLARENRTLREKTRGALRTMAQRKGLGLGGLGITSDPF